MSAKPVKCVVWDLDNTLWDGVLLEDDEVTARTDAVDVIHELDQRGILHSVASRNDPATARARLAALGLDEYFLYPQIGWSSKAQSVATIVERLDIGADTVVFVDDDQFERQEVAFSHPQVRCFDSDELRWMLDAEDFTPPGVTAESAGRRALYRAAEARQRDEESYQGPKEEFLAQLGMVFSVAPAQDGDLLRAEELTVRTNQLNTTGRTYSLAQLRAFAEADDHLLLMAKLEDRYGTYGTIGLALVETRAGQWRLKLLLMSCRVLSRGVGSVLLGLVMAAARGAGARLLADLVPTDRNRMMLVTLRFAGFREIETDPAGDRSEQSERRRAGPRGSLVTLASDLERVPRPPDYLDLRVEGVAGVDGWAGD